MWHKFTMIERIIAAGTHDWVWWVDFDTLITNMTVKMEDIITDGITDVHGKGMGDLTKPGGDGKGEEVDIFLTRDWYVGGFPFGVPRTRRSEAKVHLLTFLFQN
jgi:hypothetical protein